jgi:hypothetical protein
MQCSICLDDLEGGPTLACGHRFHAACLARLAGANGTTPTRRGTLTACPNCRTTSRVAPVTSASFSVGDRVLALWGHKWFPGDVYAVKDGGSAYEIAWDDEDSCVPRGEEATQGAAREMVYSEYLSRRACVAGENADIDRLRTIKDKGPGLRLNHQPPPRRRAVLRRP